MMLVFAGGATTRSLGRRILLFTSSAWAQAEVLPSETKLRRENERLQSTIQRLRSELGERDREAARQRKEAGAQSRQIDALRRERNLAERDRHEARLRAYSLAEELQRQETRLKAGEQDLAQRKAAIEKELKESQTRVEDFQRQLSEERKGTMETAIVRDDTPRKTPSSPKKLRVSPLTDPVGETSPDAPRSAAAGQRRDRLRLAEIQRDLDLERERRVTLEHEVQRLTAESNAQEQLQSLNRSLQDARAQVLVLSNRLTDERRGRENLEVALAQVRKAVSVEGNLSDPASWKRLVEIMESRRTEADRLSAELRMANEAIVRLKGEIEAQGSSEDTSRLLATLEAENQKLRLSLSIAEKTNQNLRGKAALAERLAEMLYSGPNQ